MMLLHVAVEAAEGFEVIGAPRQAEIRQRYQCPVDGRSRHTGNTLFYSIENLIDGRMIIALEQLRKDNPTLHRNRYAALPARVFEPFEIAGLKLF
jgi:hypothetical protein